MALKHLDIYVTKQRQIKVVFTRICILSTPLLCIHSTDPILDSKISQFTEFDLKNLA